MDQPAASEEKLLKIIRKKDKAGVEKNIARKKEEDDSSGKGISRKRVSVDFWRFLNIFLLISVVFLSIFVAKKYMETKSGAVLVKPVGKEPEEAPVNPQPLTMPQTKSYNFYKQELESYDFFQAPWEAPTTPAETTTATPTYDLSKDFKLVGIVLDKKPQAIIEDLQSKQTYFLFVGDELHNAVVKKIEEGKVTFTLNGQTLELTP